MQEVEDLRRTSLRSSICEHLNQFLYVIFRAFSFMICNNFTKEVNCACVGEIITNLNQCLEFFF
jgi:hypothetical protein